MRIEFLHVISRMTALLLVSLATALAQSPQPATPAPVSTWRPAWLTEVSLGFREGYDNNVFLSGLEPRNYPTGYLGPIPGSVLAARNQGSFFETISPKVAMDLAKLLDPDCVLKTLAFSYAPDFVFYNNAPSESYIAHRIGSTLAAKCDDLSFQLDEAFTYIDGDKYGMTYPGKYFSAYGYAGPRERREQWQDRTTATLTYDQKDWFLRPTGTLLDYDLKTKQLLVPSPDNYGYMNFVDRYDISGGADVGYKLTKDFALTLGYRAGHQYQQKLPVAIDPLQQTSSSDYQRLLGGFEGTPVSWLKIKLQAGPDFRDYNAHAPVRDSNPIVFYGEGSLTATATKDDTITASWRHNRWVGSTGMLPADENVYDLSYKHQINSQWSTKLGVRAQSSDYSCGEAWSAGSHDPATALTYYRNDWDFIFSAGVQYDITTSLSLDVAYVASLGRNGQDRADLALAAGTQQPAIKRQFDDQIISMGAKYKF